MLGNLTIDFDRMELRCSGQNIYATTLEFKLLRFFIDNPERVFSRDDLIGAVWPKRKRVSERTVDTCIWHLRQKLGKDPTSPTYIQTVHGSGYKFIASGSSETAQASRRGERLSMSS